MGVGMPAQLYLDEFGEHIYAAFGHVAYHVGSSVLSKQWRDVDVRLILDDAEYGAMGLGDPRYCHYNKKWVALCLAFSALGRAITGLPIDFQIQQHSAANRDYKGVRSALIVKRTLELPESGNKTRAKAAKPDIWSDPGVVEALKTRQPDEIRVLRCPGCSRMNYYNQGGFFYCVGCGESVRVLADDEASPERALFCRASHASTLADATSDDFPL